MGKQYQGAGTGYEHVACWVVVVAITAGKGGGEGKQMVELVHEQ